MATVPSESVVADESIIQTRLEQFNQLPSQKKLGFMIAAAAIIALLVGAWMWSQTPDYRVLYSNLSDDQDGGEIINALQQMNVPYKFSKGGSTILVPDNQVHDVRLKLASQGLPKGGLAGFELMENQKFGSSQFLEQVNYQRAIEGELSRSVQSLSAVQSARVHLAIPKSSVFARERKQPSASVLLNLIPGRSMSTEQINAITHLVSSSVPSLETNNVTVVDQDGNLLNLQADDKSNVGLDADQLQYIAALEEGYIKRIETILTPIAGRNNVRAQVTTDVDFSRIERAEEIYRPNDSEENPATIRSQQNVESMSTGSNFDGGIPGALTNRPPEPAQAPIEVDVGEVEDGVQDNEPAVPTDQRSESTINYEVDKTTLHTQESTGGIKRLSAAVVVNFRANTDEEGNVTYEPLTAKEIEDINNLAKNAVGYNEARGDTLTVTNSLFSEAQASTDPLWKDPDMLMLGKEIGKQLLIAALVLFFLLKVLRPFLKSLAPQPPVEEPPLAENALEDGGASEQNRLAGEGGEQNMLTAEETLALEQSTEKAANRTSYEENLKKAKKMAIEEPVIVANVIKEWVAGDGGK